MKKQADSKDAVPINVDPRREISAEEHRTGGLILEAVVLHLVGPLIGRYGRMDQVIAWIRTAALFWIEAFRTRLPVGRPPMYGTPQFPYHTVTKSAYLR